MIKFILNQELITTDLPAGTTLLDFIRYHQGLPGTKIGCREGDCGACTVLEGRIEREPGKAHTGPSTIRYHSIVSCLTPLGNAQGKHIVTIEGLNMEKLSPVQQAFVDHNGTQCGFCTPGFIISLTGHAINSGSGDPEMAIAAIDGNICRCTGYKSIERAAISISRMLHEKDPEDPLSWLVDHGFLPGYFLEIPSRLEALHADQGSHTELDTETSRPEETEISGRRVVDYKGQGNRDVTGSIEDSGSNNPDVQGSTRAPRIIGGGTDLMVQRPYEMAETEPLLVSDIADMKGISRENDQVSIGASATATDIMESPVMAGLFPRIRQYFKLISSSPIRNMGTLAGNLVNASPIGDLSIIFLALDAQIETAFIRRGNSSGQGRRIALKDFFLGYKLFDLKPGEVVINLIFRVPDEPVHFNFEKVSKRTHLDIASVNGAILVEVEGGMIKGCHAGCGGVAPVPLYLEKTCQFLAGKPLKAVTLVEANKVLQQEITPISDVRGTAVYKRLLARQLFYAHFIRLFPTHIRFNEIMRKATPE